VMATGGRIWDAQKQAKLALQHAEDLKMPYDEGLIREFMGTYLSVGAPARANLERAQKIHKELDATWNCEQIGE
jgi:hypothetical protein